MGSNFLEPGSANIITNVVPVGAYAPVFRSGDAYKAVGELVQRSVYTALSAAFPRNGSVSSEKQATAFPTGTIISGIAYGAGLFVAVGKNATANGVVFTSADGKNWVQRADPGAGKSWTCIIFAGGQFVALSTQGAGNGAMTSPDGLTWTSRTLPSADQWSGIAYGGGKYVAVAVAPSSGTGSTNAAAYSSDGITWTASTMPSSGNWTSVSHNGTIFVAIGGLGGVSIAASSTNGTSWTARTAPAGFSSGKVIAVGSSFMMGLVDGLYTTTDAVSYVKRIIPSSSIPVGLAYGNGVYIAVVSDGVILTSYDMDNWIPKSIISGIALGPIGYGIGVFVSVPSGSSQVAGQIYAENLTDSDYLYLSGTAGQFIRVK